MPDAIILAQVYEVRYGEPFDAEGSENLSQFLRELLDYRNVVRRSGRTTIAAAAIRSWLVPRGKENPKRSIPRREEAMSFLHGYVVWINRSGRVPDGQRKIQSASLESTLRGYLESYLPPVASPTVTTPTPQGDAVPADTAVDPEIQNMVRAVFVASASYNFRSERDDFFRGGAEEGEERSYYVLYRYSTNYGAVLKSFMKLNTPGNKGNISYTFDHFIQGGLNADGSSYDVFKEADGVIIKSERSYYLVGYHFTIPINKHLQPSLFESRRNIHRKKPNGLCMLACEYEAFAYDNGSYSHGLITALMMTTAASHQPIIARTVLMHLGTRSAFGLPINDEHIQPSELPVGNVADDLKAMVARLQRLGVATFSDGLQAEVSRKDWDGDGHKRLAATILQSIDNSPDWERVSRPKGRPQVRGRGAIETTDLSGEKSKNPQRPRN